MMRHMPTTRCAGLHDGFRQIRRLFPLSFRLPDTARQEAAARYGPCLFKGDIEPEANLLGVALGKTLQTVCKHSLSS